MVPTKVLPTQASPAATAPCMASRALEYASRAAWALGVMPCSIRVTRQASTRAVWAGVGT